MAPAAFGENISTSGLTEAEVCVGDVFALGGARLQVSQGRQPCLTLNFRFGRRDMARRMQETMRCGWYITAFSKRARRSRATCCGSWSGRVPIGRSPAFSPCSTCARAPSTNSPRWPRCRSWRKVGGRSRAGNSKAARWKTGGGGSAHRRKEALATKSFAPGVRHSATLTRTATTMLGRCTTL